MTYLTRFIEKGISADQTALYLTSMFHFAFNRPDESNIEL